MQKAYCIVNILKIHDQEAFNDYIVGHIPSIEKFGGGEFLVKGDRGEVLEGSWESNLIVIHGFPSIGQFKAWYYSDDYLPWKELRQSCADVNVILTKGS
jgi:uncharacterized protein (DUF1330 family)